MNNITDERFFQDRSKWDRMDYFQFTRDYSLDYDHREPYNELEERVRNFIERIKNK